VTLVALRVEVAFASDPGGGNPVYQDVSTRVLACSINRGRQYELDTVQPSTLTLRLDNGDRALDPTYTGSPYYPNVLPMRPVRVSATYAGTTYYLFTGYVERWPITWDAPAWGSATLSGIDGMAVLATALVTGSFIQETTGARISEILTAASWAIAAPVSGANYWVLGTGKLGTTTVLSYNPPTSIIDTGRSLVQAVTLATSDNTAALAHIQAMADAERGLFFIDGQGRAVFHDRAHRFNTSSAGTFVDAKSTPSGIYYQDLQPDMDAARVFNDVTVTATPGGTAQNATDATSQLRYLRRSMNLSPPLVTDSDALNQATFELALRKDARLRFEQMVVKPQGQEACWAHALGREISDKILVQRLPATRLGANGQINQSCFIESIQHDIKPGEWTTTFQLSPADLYTGWLTLGTAKLGSPANTPTSAALGF
jgi:hypothetical protein